MFAALCDDLLAENRELDAFVCALPEVAWSRPTAFFGWTIRDELLHLHQVDRFGLLSLRTPEAFAAEVMRIRALQAEGVELSEQIRREFAGRPDAAVLATWRTTYESMVEEFRHSDPKTRLKWFGPDMSLVSFASARIMEVWAHGQDILDLVGASRQPTGRLRHICELGVRTFSWSFHNRGREVPPAPCVVLVGPAGETWEWQGDGNGTVHGTALDFAMVVTQRRPVEETGLVATGEDAAEWLRIAQCFAGAPQERAAPGTRPPL